jgi:hypothetical protein
MIRSDKLAWERWRIKTKVFERSEKNCFCVGK